jgi:hypothetical protein
MMPGNPVVGGVILRRAAIQSPDFVAGVSGWAINADGTSEFNSVTFYTPAGQSIQINASGISLFADSTVTDPDSAYINADVPGDVFLDSGLTSTAGDVNAFVQCTSKDSTQSSSAGSNVTLGAATVTLNSTTSSDIPHAHVTGLPLSGAATLAQVITAVNNLYAALQACAIIAP